MENIVITEQGKQLMSKVISETESMTFTKIAVSDYDYSGIELQNISELQSVKQTAIISKTSRTDGKTVEILAAINNEQIPESYYVRTLGVYVKDSSENEILYGISISGENPDYMPAYEGKTLSGVSYRINVAVEDSEYITVNVNPAAVPTIMQVEDIDTAFREHTEDKVSHITAVERKKWDAVTEKVNKEEGKGLSQNDFTDADKKKLDGIDKIDALLKRLRMLVPDKILAVVKFSYTTGAVTIRWYRLNKDYTAAVILKGNVDNVDAQIDGELFATVEIGNHNKYIDKLTDFPNIYYGVLQLLDAKGDKNLGVNANAIPDNSTGTFRWWVSLFVPKIAIDADAAKTSTNSEIELMSFDYEASLLGASDAVNNLMNISGGTGSDIFTSIAGTEIKSAVEDS